MNKARSEIRTQLITPVVLGLLLPVAGAFYGGCKKKDEPPPPLPSAAPAPAPAAPLQLAPEDAGVDAPVEAETAKKHVGHYVPASSFSKCCAALLQNSKSAPPPTSIYMAQAAAACSAAVAAGKQKNSIMAAIQGALRGAGMPASCR